MCPMRSLLNVTVTMELFFLKVRKSGLGSEEAARMLSSRHEVSGTPYSSTLSLPPPVMDTLVTDMEWSECVKEWGRGVVDACG